MKLRLIPVLLATVTTIASAQSEGDLVSSVAPLFKMIRGNVAKAAEQMPEANYGFKPTPEVRSFGQLVAHVANASYMFCSAAMGEKSPATVDFEKSVTAKADLVKGLNEALAYCDKAYTMSDAKAAEKMEFFGTKGNRLFVLNFNVAHDWEHYGNMVTYLRLKGLVPPSSQGN